MTPFANCSGFTENQIIILAALRGGTSAVLVIATLVLMVVTCACRSKLGKENKRLKGYLFALFGVSICYLTVLSLGVVYHLLPDSIAGTWCVAFGFLDQTISVIQITLLFVVIMVVLWTRGHEKNMSGNKSCALRVLLGAIIVTAVLIEISSVVPFITDTYGEVGGWCWIYNFNEYCEQHFVGLLEQIFLWIIFHALISLICILMVLRAVIKFLWACKGSRKINYDRLDNRHGLKHLFFKYIFQLIILVPVFVDVTDFVLVVHTHHYNFAKWAVFATAHPIGAFLIPLSFLLYIKFGHAKSRNLQQAKLVNPTAKNEQVNRTVKNEQVNGSMSRRNIQHSTDLREEIQSEHTPFVDTVKASKYTSTDAFSFLTASEMTSSTDVLSTAYESPTTTDKTLCDAGQLES